MQHECQMVSRSFAIGDLAFKAYDPRVFRDNGRILALQQKEFLLLSYLALHWNSASEELVTRQELMDHMYPEGAVTRNHLHVFISKVRKRLAQEESTVTIRTIPNKGYKLEVSESAAN